MDKKEIKLALIGRIMPLEGNIWVVAPPEARIPVQGLSDGSGNVRLFGITQRERFYRVDRDTHEAFLQVAPIIGKMGKIIQLEESPETAACLYRSFWASSVLLALDWEADGLRLTAYTGRAMSAWWACRHAMDRFEKKLPDWVIKEETEKKEEEKPDKQEEKTGKKDEKETGTSGKKGGSPKAPAGKAPEKKAPAGNKNKKKKGKKKSKK